ncbi:MAG: hypothetical protein ACKVOP_08220 [Sphingomonadaceae bacterium]
MRFRARYLIGTLALAAMVPALAQRGPESILPPGFGDPPAPPPKAAPPVKAPDNPSPAPEPSAPTPDVPDVAIVPPSPGVSETTSEPANSADNAMAAVAELQDLPPAAQRSLDQVGLLAEADGGMGAGAFGGTDGRFLTTLMRSAKVPITSRWASITLRRALLSQSRIPAGVGGADWVAERAWLLVRMGEADNARALVQRVDAVNHTPWLYDVAMQAALASADPAGLCGIADGAAAVSDKPSWTLARAMCAGLEAEGGTASALAGRVRDTRRATGIDVLLAEKVAGAGTNTRRAITIQWDGVTRLSAWRYGLAAATGVAIPRPLYGTVGPQVQAWAARAPLYAPAARVPFAERAATLGVFSSAALVDLHGSVFDATDAADRTDLVANQLRAAFTGGAGDRLDALKRLWTGAAGPYGPYARAILTARAAATLPADAATSDADRDALIGAMLSAGLDIQAVRLAPSVTSGSLGWGLLAVGAPQTPFAISASTVEGFDGELRSRFLFAGLAGLGRLSADETTRLAESLAVPVSRQTSWTRALARAVAAREPGTVALLAAIGLQTTDWAFVPPEHLYHIVTSLRQVGLEPEARMIAAEAIARS